MWTQFRSVSPGGDNACWLGVEPAVDGSSVSATALQGFRSRKGLLRGFHFAAVMYTPAGGDPACWVGLSEPIAKYSNTCALTNFTLTDFKVF